MAPLQFRFASVAAVLAVQLGFNPTTAGESPAENELSVQQFASNVFSSFFGDGFLASANHFEDVMNSLFGTPELNVDMAVPTRGNTQISLSLPNADEKSCQVAVTMGSRIRAKDIKVGLESGSHHLFVKYWEEVKHDEKDEKKGEVHFTSHVNVTQSVQLPANCLAVAEFGGYMVDEENNQALIVFPAIQTLEEHASAGKLPEGIVEMLENEDEKKLSELTPEQLCLVAGFTIEQCEKLGNKRPVILSVPNFDGEKITPVGLYEGSLQQLD